MVAIVGRCGHEAVATRGRQCPNPLVLGFISLNSYLVRRQLVPRFTLRAVDGRRGHRCHGRLRVLVVAIHHRWVRVCPWRVWAGGFAFRSPSVWGGGAGRGGRGTEGGEGRKGEEGRKGPPALAPEPARRIDQAPRSAPLALRWRSVRRRTPAVLPPYSPASMSCMKLPCRSFIPDGSRASSRVWSPLPVFSHSFAPQKRRVRSVRRRRDGGAGRSSGRIRIQSRRRARGGGRVEAGGGVDEVSGEPQRQRGTWVEPARRSEPRRVRHAALRPCRPQPATDTPRGLRKAHPPLPDPMSEIAVN